MFISAKRLAKIEGRLRDLEHNGGNLRLLDRTGCLVYDIDSKVVTVSHSSVLRQILQKLGISVRYQHSAVVFEAKNLAAGECRHGWTEAIIRDAEGHTVRCRQCGARRGLSWTK